MSRIKAISFRLKKLKDTHYVGSTMMIYSKAIFPSIVICLLLLFVSTSAAVADGFVVTSTSFSLLSIPGATAILPWDINNQGVIAGTYFDSSSNAFGFVDANGIITTISYPGEAGKTYVQGINDLGQVVGAAGSTAFIYSAGSFTPISGPGGLGLDPFGINNKGQIVGDYASNDGISHGFLLSGQTFTTIDNPNGYLTFLYGINNSGEIAGTYRVVEPDFYRPDLAFTYSSGQFTSVSPCPSANNLPASISFIRPSDSGAIVGTCGQGFVQYQGQTVNFNAPFYTHTELYGLNDRNELVGAAYDKIQIPEPSSGLLAFVGLLVALSVLLGIRKP